jgi:hypothetical protein
MTAITIRPEQPGDVPAIRRVNEQAFDKPTEAQLVDTLRRTCPDFLSLVAEDNTAEGDTVVGHILFTPVIVECEGRQIVGSSVWASRPWPCCPLTSGAASDRNWSHTACPHFASEGVPSWSSSATQATIRASASSRHRGMACRVSGSACPMSCSWR